MYKATIDGRMFFSTAVDDEGTAIVNPKLSLEVGKAGEFGFDIYPSNLEYNAIVPLVPIVKLYRKDKLIFSGRVFDYSVGFNNEKHVTCEGLLAIFNDSAQPPFEFGGTISEFLSMIIKNHNNQVNEAKKVKLGNVTVVDNNDYIARSRDHYVKSMELLNDTASTLGGYFVLRAEDDGYYLDFINDYTGECTQSVNFGENLLDVKRQLDAAKLITAIIPIGADVESTTGGNEEAAVAEGTENTENGLVSRKKVTIASVNNGSDMLVDEKAVAQHGFIVGIEEWPDVTRPENLKTKATKELARRLNGSTSIEVSAADLAAVNNDINGFLCGEYVQIKSAPHKLDEKMLIKKQSIELLQPASNKLTLGDTKLGFIESSRDESNKYKDIVKKIEANYATNEAVNDSYSKIDAVKVNVESIIDQKAESIKAEVSKTYETSEHAKKEYAKIELNSKEIKQVVEDVNGMKLAITVNSDYVEIGKSDSDVKSRQDNKSYKFVDKSNEVLLELNTKGVNAPAVNIQKQLRIGDKWAIRHGSYIEGRGYNLNDMWIGG